MATTNMKRTKAMDASDICGVREETQQAITRLATEHRLYIQSKMFLSTVDKS